jgi:hypothetical protein
VLREIHQPGVIALVRDVRGLFLNNADSRPGRSTWEVAEGRRGHTSVGRLKAMPSLCEHVPSYTCDRCKEISVVSPKASLGRDDENWHMR